jgi:hypothetical protein
MISSVHLSPIMESANPTCDNGGFLTSRLIHCPQVSRPLPLRHSNVLLKKGDGHFIVFRCYFIF